MTTDNFLIIIELFLVISSSATEKAAKEEAIKKLVSFIIDTQPNFGPKTKEALKVIVSTAENEQSLFNAVSEYLTTQNCND